MGEAGCQGIKEKAQYVLGWRPGVTAATWPLAELTSWVAAGVVGKQHGR